MKFPRSSIRNTTFCLFGFFVLLSSWKFVNNTLAQINDLPTSLNQLSHTWMNGLRFQLHDPDNTKAQAHMLSKTAPIIKLEVLNQINPGTFPIPSVILNYPNTQGIGDQLYRYAFSYSTARHLNTTLYIAITVNDTSLNRQYLPNQRTFALDHFNIDIKTKLLRFELIQKLPPKKRMHLNELGPWRKKQLPRDKIILIEDGWQAEMYWNEYLDDIKNQFVLKQDVLIQIESNADLLNIYNGILATKSVAVHIRRGDFNGKGFDFRIIPISYQIRAIKLIRDSLLKHEELKFFIFSDEITYVKNALEFKFKSNQLVFMPANTSSLIEFYLMTSCKHFIITNSGFSWWTAYLGNYRDKTVVAPFPRHRFRYYDAYGKKSIYREHKEWIYWSKSYPDNWITLNPFESYQDSYS